MTSQLKVTEYMLMGITVIMAMFSKTPKVKISSYSTPNSQHSTEITISSLDPVPTTVDGGLEAAPVLTLTHPMIIILNLGFFIYYVVLIDLSVN